MIMKGHCAALRCCLSCMRISWVKPRPAGTQRTGGTAARLSACLTPSEAQVKPDTSHATPEQLLKVAAAKLGTPEEVTALLAALLRAHGLRTRYVRSSPTLRDAGPQRAGHHACHSSAGSRH